MVASSFVPTWRSADELHRATVADLRRTLRPTCDCTPLAIREDAGLRCARCDAPLVAVNEVRR